jgi:hypothetical protein
MKKILKYLGYIILATFILIQFFRPKSNANTVVATNQIQAAFAVPNDVDVILKKACNDCHSNNTKYPWYSNIQPVAWWLNDHVVDGKKHINFDEYASYKLRKQYHKFEEIIEQVEANEMPLSNYTLIHSEAKLNANEKIALTNWAKACMDSMKAHHPIDSLIRKKQ